MKDNFRQAMAWLHTWSGLVFTWLLFAIFFTGTLSFYRNEITLWMQPELHTVAPEFAPEAAIGGALAELHRRAPDAKSWNLTLPTTRDAALTVSWDDGGKFDRAATFSVDPHSGTLLQPRATLGGSFFRSFHFSLMWGNFGIWIVGIATLVMLVALLTGIVIHKKIFKDFFTFRPHKAQARSWLDAHNASSVLSLPFILMITYTGLATLMFTWMPAAVGVMYQGDKKVFQREAFARREAPPRDSQAAPLAALPPLLEQTRAHWQGALLGRVVIHNPGAANALIDIVRWRGSTMTARLDPIMRFNGVSGALEQELINDSGAKNTYGVFYGLHVAWFADFFLRGLLFGMGCAGCAMIASGAILWTVKRRAKHAAARGLGYRLVEALNVAGIAGLMLACAVYFWANRLLPVGIDGRIAWEQRCLFIAWLLALVHAMWRGNSSAAWREQLWTAAALTALLPVLNAATGGLALPHAIWQGHWRLAGVDLMALFFAILLAWSGWRIGLQKDAAQSGRPSIKTAVNQTSTPIKNTEQYV